MCMRTGRCVRLQPASNGTHSFVEDEMLVHRHADRHRVQGGRCTVNAKAEGRPLRLCPSSWPRAVRESASAALSRHPPSTQTSARYKVISLFLIRRVWRKTGGGKEAAPPPTRNVLRASTSGSTTPHLLISHARLKGVWVFSRYYFRRHDALPPSLASVRRRPRAPSLRRLAS